MAVGIADSPVKVSVDSCESQMSRIEHQTAEIRGLVRSIREVVSPVNDDQASKPVRGGLYGRMSDHADELGTVVNELREVLAQLGG